MAGTDERRVRLERQLYGEVRDTCRDYGLLEEGDHVLVALSGGKEMQLRWEIFNLLNRTNFDVPNRIAFTPNFGRIFSAKPPRQMQFGAKVLF